jgi:hypothetical protein
MVAAVPFLRCGGLRVGVGKCRYAEWRARSARRGATLSTHLPLRAERMRRSRVLPAEGRRGGGNHRVFAVSAGEAQILGAFRQRTCPTLLFFPPAKQGHVRETPCRRHDSRRNPM